MKKLASVLLFIGLVCGFPHHAHAVTCNPTDISGCPASDCPATANVLTSAAVPGTAWTQDGVSTASVDCYKSIEYNNVNCPITNPGGSQCLIDFWMPHEAPSNPNNYELIICYHGGGFTVGNRQSCWGDGFNPNVNITKVQELLGTPNAVGGKGVVIVSVDYRLAVSAGTNTFPAQWQDAKCAIWYLLANGGNSTFPFNKSLIGMYGPSAGGTVAWWAGSTPDNLYTTACPSSPSVPTNGYRVVSAWPAMNFMLPTGFSNWECSNNNVATVQPAWEQILNCSSQATCRTQASSLNADEVSNISQGNIAAFKRSQQMFQFGLTDQLILPYYSASTQCTSNGGNVVGAMNAYQALSPAINPVVELLPNCAHECDLMNLNAPSVTDAFSFLLNRSSGYRGGMNATGILGGG